MFITQLTKYDWYRIYKYLWKEHLVPTTKGKRTFIRLCTIFYQLVTLYMILDSLSYILIDPYFTIFYIIIFILLGSVLSPLLYLVCVREFSPKVFISLKEIMPNFEFKQLYKKYPTAYISKYGLFSPPSNYKWTVLVFKDCYLLYINFSPPYDHRKRFMLLNVIRRTDIADKNDFLKQLEPICQRPADYSKIKLLHGK